jgi:hypothetical protein
MFYAQSGRVLGRCCALSVVLSTALLWLIRFAEPIGVAPALRNQQLRKLGAASAGYASASGHTSKDCSRISHCDRRRT